jgi:hypothetical protein
MPMNLEERDFWCKNLKSGEYPQEHGSMHNRDKTAFCCLGVAREIFPRYTQVETTTGTSWFTHMGLTEDIVTDLINLNDGVRWTFPQIAGWIEQNVPVLVEENVV